MISFNNIPTSIRTPGAYVEVDNSRALQGLVQNPHKALIIGQRIAAGTVGTDTLIAITRDNLADGFFGPGSNLARMCNKFKENNPNTELFALALSDNAAGIQASGYIEFDGSATAAGTVYLLIGGVPVYEAITSGWSATDVASAVKSTINADSTLCVTASVSATSTTVVGLKAVDKGTIGNQYDFRVNYYTGQSTVAGITPSTTAMSGGANDPDISDAWAIIDDTQVHYIVQPWTDATNLTALESELSTRFGPLVEKQGHAFVGYRGTQANCTTIGNSRNSPHNTIIGAYNSPTNPDDWGAALGAIAAFNLNNDPARPLHFLQLKGVLAPPDVDRFTRSERDILLYDGIATWTVDSSDNVLIERSITTYQTNALGISDPSYLDVQTLATLSEIRFQYLVRMTNRFIIPRFKLADDTFPVQPGMNIATPKTVKQEIIALFTDLRDVGLIENLEDFATNLVVERNAADPNRVDALLPPDLVNQFRILAGQIQFIL